MENNKELQKEKFKARLSATQTRLDLKQDFKSRETRSPIPSRNVAVVDI
jgi:hypothetical protein